MGSLGSGNFGNSSNFLSSNLLKTFESPSNVSRLQCSVINYILTWSSTGPNSNGDMVRSNMPWAIWSRFWYRCWLRKYFCSGYRIPGFRERLEPIRASRNKATHGRKCRRKEIVFWEYHHDASDCVDLPLLRAGQPGQDAQSSLRIIKSWSFAFYSPWHGFYAST